MVGKSLLFGTLMLTLFTTHVCHPQTTFRQSLNGPEGGYVSTGSFQDSLAFMGG